MKPILVHFVLCVCLITGPALAAESPRGTLPLDLSLEEAVLLGLRHNHELRIEQLEPVIAGAFERTERGEFDPELFGEVNFSEESVSETDRATQGQFDVEGKDAEAIVGLRQRLPTGTEVELTAGTDRSTSTRSPEQQSVRFGLTVTQQLLRGFGPAVGLASLRQARLDTLASVSELRGFAEALIANIETAYWELVLANESILVFQKSLEVAEAQLSDIETRIDVGQISEKEAAAARADVALAKQDLIDAESAQRVRRYELIRRIYPKLPLSATMNFRATTKPDVEAIAIPDAGERVRLALQSRPEIKEAEYRIQRGELETVVTRNGRLPELAFFVNLGKSGFATTFQESFREVDGPNYEARVGIQFSQSLGNRSARARDDIARATLRQSEEALANLRSLVRYDVLLALNELERAQKQMTASSNTRRYRQETFEAEQDRFEVGNATALEVSRTQRDLVESQIAEIEARVAYQLAKIQLYIAEGNLLDRRGLVVETAGM
ncbi:MAG: TolC family protein [Verrucomicrobia bacterium]|jgi:outer membrane protein TolC|nr:TolC family protein [Verrucomicrobiota bacterium]